MPHTPGPWRKQRVGPYEYDFISGGTFLGIGPGSGSPTKLDTEDEREFEANVDLLLNAPEMLKLLKRMPTNISSGGLAYKMAMIDWDVDRRNVLAKINGAS